MKYLIVLLALMLSPFAVAQEPTSNGDIVLVVPDPQHPWAAAQIGSALGDSVSYHEGSLLQAITIAQSGKAKGVIEIKLDTDAAWETGRVICYTPSGKKLWEEKVFFNFGGGAEGVARKFADKLEKKVTGKHCSVSST